MNAPVKKFMLAVGKAVTYILLTIGLALLLAERFHEGPMLNAIRSLM